MTGLWQEAVAAMRGTAALARGEADALKHFNVSADGFWHSFAAFLPLLPVYLFLQQSDALMSGTGFAPFADSLTALGQWLSWPLIALAIAQGFGLTRDYARYIIVYNWSSLPFALLFLPGALLLRFSMAGAGMAVALNLAALAITLGFGYLVARRALGARPGVAFLIVLADFFYGQLISAIAG